MYNLVCTQDFANFKKGDRITDPTAVTAAMANHHHHVVRVPAPDVSAPSTK